MVDFTGGTWRSLIDGSEVSAIPDGLILYPEEDDLDNFIGDVSAFDINDTAPIYDPIGDVDNNGLSLKLPSATNTIGSLSGLRHYPQTDQRFRFAYNFSDGSVDNIDIMYSSENGDYSGGGYELVISGSDNRILLRPRDNGSATDTTINASITHNDNEFYVLDLLHESNGDVTLDVFDKDGNSAISSATGNDSSNITDGEFDHTGISIRSANGDPNALDLWRSV